MTDRTRWRYEHCGWTVDSALAIPELAAGAPGSDRRTDRHPDVLVRVEPGAAAIVPSPWAQSDSGTEGHFTAPDAGEYVVRAGREIIVRPGSAADPFLVRLFLLGFAWAALITQRGGFALHAGITASDDGALAFCGPSGAGKSSAVTWLLRHGHRLVSDDLTRLDLPKRGAPLVWPSTPWLKLSPESLGAQGWPRDDGMSELPDGKLHLRPPARRQVGPVPLMGIYLLTWGAPARRRLRGMEAVRRLLGDATYRPQLFAAPESLAAHWRHCLEIVTRVPVWELSRPRDWAELDATMHNLPGTSESVALGADPAIP